MSWHVLPDADDRTAATVLATDRWWAGYSLADLEAPFRAYSTVAVAARDNAKPEAACLFLRHPAFNATIPHGQPTGVAAILNASALPDTTYVLARAEHWPAMEGSFAFTQGYQTMARMAVNTRTFVPAGPVAGMRRLTAADAELVRGLYARYPANAFNDDQLATGIFFGVFDPASSDGLVAIAGTHAVAHGHRIGAVGGVFTLPATRGRGYARRLTSAVTAELFALGCEDVILNVAVDNPAARGIYERLGYVTHCLYREARATRRPNLRTTAPVGTSVAPNAWRIGTIPRPD